MFNDQSSIKALAQKPAHRPGAWNYPLWLVYPVSYLLYPPGLSYHLSLWYPCLYLDLILGHSYLFDHWNLNFVGVKSEGLVICFLLTAS